MELGGCRYRDDILYDPESGIWGIDKGELWRVGVTPLLSWLSGGFTSVSVKPPGTAVGKGGVFGSAEGPRHFEVLRAPFSGVVREVNPGAIADPRSVNRDPFGAGWVADLEKTGSETSLVSLEEAAAGIEDKIRAMHVHCFAEFPDSELYELGIECSATLAKLDELLARSPVGTVVHLVSDDATAEIELERWKDQTGNSLLESRRDGSVSHFLLKKR